VGPFSRAPTVHLLADGGGLPIPRGDVSGLNPLKAWRSIALSMGAQNDVSEPL
jgi:hypothetical protein